MSVKTVVIGVLGLGIIITALAVALSFLMENQADASTLVLNVIDLKQKADDSVARAKAVTSIDKAVKSLHNEAISESWQTLLECLQKGCVPDDYFNLIAVIVQERKEEIANSDLIFNILVVQRFWGGENIVEFSKALAAANDAIEQLGSKTASNKWSEIIACNGTCKERDDLFFDMIKLII
ncbi:MAG: hypothetical protein QW666_01070 [Candidatus Woesearchaeota archaeon]